MLPLFRPRVNALRCVRFAHFKPLGLGVPSLSLKPSLGNPQAQHNKGPRLSFVAPSGLFLTLTGGSLLLLNSTSPVLNETTVSSPAITITVTSQEETRAKRKSYYRQLCLGSILGVVAGLLLIKVSVVVLYIAGLSLLGLEWLRSRNIITVNHGELARLTKSNLGRFFNFGKNSVSDMNLFKISFVFAAGLTYYNV